jgi:alkanesulfonate monooxygenase SsuD/methylene tetrahydromethanopterin reductase-like flavin-dependent oxidoreductase (luciferase family)
MTLLSGENRGIEMMDYRRPLRFGYFLEPLTGAPLVEMAREADRLGLDLIGVPDHPYRRRYVDTLSLLGVLAASTSRIKVFPNVACLPLRPPAELAQAIATIDRLSGGRIELGLGAGSFWDPIEGFGGPRRSPGEAVGAVEEAMQLIRLMWSGLRGVRFDGDHYRLRNVDAGPIPDHQVGIWLGALGPRMLELTGRLADGWTVSTYFVPPSRLPEMHERIDGAAIAADREPAGIQRIYTVAGRITPGRSEGFLVGPVKQWVDELTELAVGHGMDTFLYAGESGAALRTFALKIAPAVREQVARERGAVRLGM